MTPEENKKIIATFYQDVFNRRNFHLAPQFLAPDFRRHDIAQLFPDRFGTDGAKEQMAALIAGIPDLQMDDVDVFADGDRVCVRYIARGTHTGELLGRPGTGRPVRWEGVNIYRMVDGKIAETWQYADAVSFLRQIGAMPPERS